ncbi:hypothetical protein NP493_1046g00063 [Ridgeia piscesae]|uniref:Uncharacterized protein n=1 Tax=Ridgeia piscesae TaxID=27915 RepID=A0AAD9KHF8_RIDPI|nr:hypothetical protein NP493_1046g00063 [Ridgeia piscesae]
MCNDTMFSFVSCIYSYLFITTRPWLYHYYYGCVSFHVLLLSSLKGIYMWKEPVYRHAKLFCGTTLQMLGDCCLHLHIRCMCSSSSIYEVINNNRSANVM